MATVIRVFELIRGEFAGESKAQYIWKPCGSCSYNIINILRGDEVSLCPHFVVFNWTMPIIPVFLYMGTVYYSALGFEGIKRL
jgi:hypothetical protein